MTFEWDPEKEKINILKHGVSFEVAQRAFADEDRKIYPNPKHSSNEERWFCFGKVDGRVLTVRFTWRDGVVRLIGAGYWRKGVKMYEKKISV